MLKSMHRYMNLTVSIKPFISRDGTGAKRYGTTITSECYVEGKNEVITNSQGKEVVSMKQLYLPGTCPITELDNIVFDGLELEIKAIANFYRNGVIDMKVVYV